MKKWIWLVLLVLLVVVAAGCFEKQRDRSATVQEYRSPVVEGVRVEKGDKGKGSDDAPQVSADKLFRHIQRLSFTRNSPAERSRARKYITTELKRFGWQPKLEKFTDGVNILAERQGTDGKAGAILVGAHYDTVYISPGADDNASGVAVLLEIARLLNSLPTPRTLQLAFFDKEEAGLLGSKAFVKNSTHLQNLHGVIVMDMVGFSCYDVGCQKYPAGLPVAPPSDKGNFVAVVGDAEHLPLLGAFDKSTNQPPVLTLPIPLKGLLTPDVLRSDHAPFWYQGIGAVLVTDTANLRTPHYHQPSDVPGTIDRKFFTGVAQVVVNATIKLLESNGV